MPPQFLAWSNRVRSLYPCWRDAAAVMPRAVEAPRLGDRPRVDVFDSEKVFVERTFASLRATFGPMMCSRTSPPRMRRFRRDGGPTSPPDHSAPRSSTATPCRVGPRPHSYCLPSPSGRKPSAVRRAAKPAGQIFLDTDSAPQRSRRRNRVRCAGIFNAPLRLRPMRPCSRGRRARSAGGVRLRARPRF